MLWAVEERTSLLGVHSLNFTLDSLVPSWYDIAAVSNAYLAYKQAIHSWSLWFLSRRIDIISVVLYSVTEDYSIFTCFHVVESIQTKSIESKNKECFVFKLCHSCDQMIRSIILFPNYNIYKVYLNPCNPSMTLPPAAALLFALINFKSRAKEMTMMSAAANMQVRIPGL